MYKAKGKENNKWSVNSKYTKNICYMITYSNKVRKYDELIEDEYIDIANINE